MDRELKEFECSAGYVADTPARCSGVALGGQNVHKGDHDEKRAGGT